jgi:ribosomal protein S18 acetylase RimI-like enzyme
MTGMPLTFRFALAADVPAIVALVESAYRGEESRAGWTTEADLLDGGRTDTAAVQAILDAEDGLLLLAEYEGQLAACCQLERRPGAVAYFGMFSVRPGHQGQGWGRKVLARAEQVARQDLEAGTMVMTVLAPRHELIAWYERRGYRRTGETSPFPYGNARFWIPRRPDLSFVGLAKDLTA